MAILVAGFLTLLFALRGGKLEGFGLFRFRWTSVGAKGQRWDERRHITNGMCSGEGAKATHSLHVRILVRRTFAVQRCITTVLLVFLVLAPTQQQFLLADFLVLSFADCVLWKTATQRPCMYFNKYRMKLTNKTLPTHPQMYHTYNPLRPSAGQRPIRMRTVPESPFRRPDYRSPCCWLLSGGEADLYII